MVENIRGQRAKKCEATGCPEYGRVLARMGDMEIAYCPYHRKKFGERIISALINSLFNYKLSNFMSEIKTEIFMNEHFLCEECSKKTKEYIISKTEELEKILEFQENNEAEYKERDELN